MKITDAITNESISPGTPVVAIIVSTIENSDKRPDYFLGRSEGSEHKFASLPVRGIWNGYSVTDVKKGTIIEKLNNQALPLNCAGFDGIQDQLKIQSFRKLFIHKQAYSQQLKYSMMVVREDTYDLLQGVDAIKNKVGLHTPENDLKSIEVSLVDLTAKINEIGADVVDNNRRYTNMSKEAINLRDQLEIVIADTTFKRGSLDSGSAHYSAYRINAHIPQNQYASTALSKERFENYGDGMGLILQSLTYDLADHINRHKSLPDYYPDLQKSLHDVTFITDALKVLGRGLAPSRNADEAVGLNNLQLSKQILFRELNTLTQAAALDAPGAPSAVSKEINDLKKTLAQAVRAQNLNGPSI
jgi:hypothetical protein